MHRRGSKETRKVYPYLWKYYIIDINKHEINSQGHLTFRDIHIHWHKPEGTNIVRDNYSKILTQTGTHKTQGHTETGTHTVRDINSQGHSTGFKIHSQGHTQLANCVHSTHICTQYTYVHSTCVCPWQHMSLINSSEQLKSI